jgi:hypothetical protein
VDFLVSYIFVVVALCFGNPMMSHIVEISVDERTTCGVWWQEESAAAID